MFPAAFMLSRHEQFFSFVVSWFGKAVMVRLGKARLGPAELGMAAKARLVSASPVLLRLGKAAEVSRGALSHVQACWGLAC